MKDFRPLWKERAQNKTITFTDCIQRCILLGMHKGQDFDEKVQIALRHLDRSFSPSKAEGYQQLIQRLKVAQRPYLGIANEVLETDEEKEVFEKLGQKLQSSDLLAKLGIHYCCIYLFGNLIPEQTLIQSMHASMQMGQKLTEQDVWPKNCNASNLHYLVVRGDKPGDICQNLIRHGVRFCVFEDYDYSFNNEGTLIQSDTKSVKSIMTYPVPGWKKGIFDDLELLRLEPNRPD